MSAAAKALRAALSAKAIACDRCERYVRVSSELRALRGDEGARLTLARHQKSPACVVETFAREAAAKGLARVVGQAWRLVAAHIVPSTTGPTAVRGRNANALDDEVEADNPGRHSGRYVAHGSWIPRWAAVAWRLYPHSETAIPIATALRDATEAERAAFLTAYDAGGKAPARALAEAIARRGKGPER